MIKILNSLYNSDFNGVERKVISTTETKALHKKIHNEERYFIHKMSLDDVQRFQQLQNLYMQSSSYEQEDAFAYGFKLATILMCEVFMSEDEPTSKCSD